MDYLLGFGLKSAAAHRHFESGFTLTGHHSPPNTGTNPITPEHFVTGLSNLGITASAMPSPLPVISGLYLRANYNAGLGSDKNLVDYPVILAFLNAYMTIGDKAKLDGLTVNGVGFRRLFLRKTLPYSGDAIAVSEADKVNGNLAVWLGRQGVTLEEVYVTNPTLYTSATPIGALRNVVLEGNYWKNIQISRSGVIVSVNTPAYSIDGGAANLWYVVQGQSSTHTLTATISVLEFTSGVTDASRITPPTIYTYYLDALITASAAQRTGYATSRL